MSAVVRLDDVCSIIMGQAPSGDAYNSDGVGWPLVAGAGDFDERKLNPKKYTTEATKLCAPGDIILGIRASIGAKVTADGIYCLGRGVAALRPRDGLDPRFLWNWLDFVAPELARKGKGATFKQVNRNDIGELAIELPTRTEQRRIADVLDRVDALRAKRRDALAHFDELKQSIFLDMFGDPETNPFQFDIRPCGEVCTRVTVGLVVKPASYYVDSGVPALRSLNIRPGLIDVDEIVYFSTRDNETKLSKSRIYANDVVLVRTGRPGTAAIVPQALHGANAIDILITTPDARRIDSAYLCSYFNSPTAKRFVLGEKRGQIQQHLNVASLKSARLPVPPLGLQQSFADRIRAVDALKAEGEAALLEVDSLFAALQYRAFRGEL